MNKEHIEEIALRVAKELPFDKRTSVEQICVEFAYRFQAELAKVSEPAATKIETNQFDCFHVSLEDSKKLKALPVGAKLFTHQTPQPDLVAEIERLKAENVDISVVSQLHYDQNLSLRQQLSAVTTDWNRVMDALNVDETDVAIQTIAKLQADNEQLVKALEWIEEEGPEVGWGVRKCAQTAIAAHKARQGKEES